MAQYNIPIYPTKSSPLQEQISLQSPGTMVNVGAPGGPVVFSSYGSPIIPILAGSAARNVVQAKG